MSRVPESAGDVTDTTAIHEPFPGRSRAYVKLLVRLAIALGLVWSSPSPQLAAPRAAFEPASPSEARGQTQEEAIRQERIAAEQGDAPAQYNLGFRYDNGEGVPRDDAEAVRWYRLAANQGNPDAQTNLGRMYANGEGVTEDAAEAVRWYRLAAEQGDPVAQSNLGIKYANGEGIARDTGEAVRWSLRAAEQGFGIAQYNVAVMYATGEGVSPDNVTALMWFTLAMTQFSGQELEQVQNARDIVRDPMTPAQIAEAERLVEEWEPQVE